MRDMTSMKKVTLYLAGHTLAHLDTFRELYLYSGAYVSEAPDISDVIEAMISWEAFLLNTDPTEVSVLRKYAVEEDPTGDLPETLEKIRAKATVRFLFPLKDHTQKELDDIRQKWSFNGTDTMLIRDIIKKIFSEYDGKTLADWGSIFARTYVAYLYGLTIRESVLVSLCASERITFDDLKNMLSGKGIATVRQILLEEGKIKRFKEILEQRGSGMFAKGIFRLDLESYSKDYFLLFNQELTFNYMDAYIGFVFVMNDIDRRSRDISAPPSFARLLIWYSTHPVEPKGITDMFFEELEGLLNMSRKLNRYVYGFKP